MKNSVFSLILALIIISGITVGVLEESIDRERRERKAATLGVSFDLGQNLERLYARVHYTDINGQIIVYNVYFSDFVITAFINTRETENLARADGYN